MTRSTLLLASLALLSSCDGGSTGPGSLDATYTLVAENDVALPSDQGNPAGCCLTLSGSLTLTAGAYDLRTSHRNKNNGIEFDNSEHGTYRQAGTTLTFVRLGGGGEGIPYLLGAGTVAADKSTLTLLYGDEGPGSNQIRATFRR